MKLAALLLTCALLPAQFDRAKLLNPSTPARTAPSTLPEFGKQFADPPAEWRPAPLWVWAEEMDLARMREQLASFRAQGIGGAFVHPRAGLMTEYLSPRWFELWGQSLAEAKQLGLELHIYDENSYPSGFAGGLVPARDPETVGRVVNVQAVPRDERVNWVDANLVAVYAYKGKFEEVRRLKTFERASEDEAGLIVARIEKMQPGPFQANFPYVDLTLPRTTQLFLEETHERYKKHFAADFGGAIRMAFADEPEAPRRGNGVPLNMRTLAEFRKRYGYDLADHLPSLYWPTGDWRRVRFDYWELIHDLLEESYFRAMYEWCDQNKLEFSGHWWEHMWPEPFITPADGSMYAYQHVPGIDILWTPQLRATGQQADLLFVVKQVASVARQMGRKRVLSEAYGGNGWDATPEYFKLAGDWQMVHGVNFINPHFAPTTIYGARKRDWPQHFGEWNAWWPYYRQHADHTARVALAVTAGEARPRVLVMIPSTTGFLMAEPGNREPLRQLKKSYENLVQTLAGAQVDFDLGEEYIVSWYGRRDGEQFRVGLSAYDVVVWPAEMENVRSGVVKALADFPNVLALGEGVKFVDGRAAKDPLPKFQKVSGLEELLKRLPARRIQLDNPARGAIGFAERFLDGGARLLLLTNSGAELYEANAMAEGKTLSVWNTFTGQREPLAFTREGPNVKFRVSLPPAGSLLVEVDGPALPAPARQRARTARPVPVKTWKTTAEGPNVLALDYVRVKAGGVDLGGMHTTAAADALYRAYGWPSNPWDRTIMFRRNTLDTAPAAIGGFEAEYEFEVKDEAAVKCLELVVEQARMYQVKVNGQEVEFDAARSWMDRHFLRAPIAAKQGRNVISLSAAAFDVRMELESVFLLGEFSVAEAPAGFALAAPRPMALGAWHTQGRSFYSQGAISEAEVKTAAGILRVELPSWQGSAAEVLVDGKSAGVVLWRPHAIETPVTAGNHKITVRVLGTPWNLFGPFHYKGERHSQVLWPGHTALNAPPKQPSGAEYRFAAYGLLAEPKLSVR